MPSKSTLSCLAFAGLAFLPMGACATASGPAPGPADAAANFARWEAALATRDPATVTALFSPDAILEPTVSNDVRTSPEEIRAYFVDFLKLAPRPTVNERNVRVLDENTLLDAGIWTFDLTRDGTPTWVTARYSFVWEKEDGVWKIQLLHSSLMPEPVSVRPQALTQ